LKKDFIVTSELVKFSIKLTTFL